MDADCRRDGGAVGGGRNLGTIAGTALLLAWQVAQEGFTSISDGFESLLILGFAGAAIHLRLHVPSSRRELPAG